MATSLLLALDSPSQIQDLYLPRIPKVSLVERDAVQLETVARDVERDWEGLPGAARSALEALAYAIVEPPKGVGGLTQRLKAFVFGSLPLAVLLLRGERSALVRYLNAADRLTDVILHKVEQADSRCQNQARQAVLQVVDHDRQSRPGMTADDFRQWLAGR